MRLKTVLAGVLAVWVQAALAATEVRLAVHDSYDLPKETITAFESANDAKVVILKMGDGNAMLNRLILTRNEGGVADAVYGLDNNTVAKAHAAGILAAKQPASARTVVQLPHALAVDYGFVTLNYDKKWFAEKKLPLPKTAAWRSKWRRDTRNVITSSKANSCDYNAFKQPAICVLLDLTNLRATPNALHARDWPKSALESRHHRQTAPPRANAGAARHCPNSPD